MDKVEEVIKHAELLTGGTEAEREQARAMLEKVVDGEPNTPGARKALALLEKLDGRAAAVESVPGLVEFTRRWEEIHNLTHVDLFKFLRDLTSEPAIAARLRPAVTRDLRAWIAEAAARVGEQTAPEEIEALSRFVVAVSDLKMYGMDFDELKQLRNNLFGVQFNEAERRIRAALSEWSFDDAWAALRSLSRPPASFEADVKELQDEIYRVDQMHREVADLLTKATYEGPSTWPEASTLADHARRLSRCLHEYGLPGQWRDRLKAELARCVQALDGFLRRRAGEAPDLPGVRGFWDEYRGLELDDSYGLGVPKEWVQNALGRLVKETARSVSGADSPAALDTISQQLLSELAGLPPSVIKEIEALSGQINQIAATWKAVSVGHDFCPMPPTEVPMPKAFERDLAFFHERLNVIRGAFEKLKEGDATPAGETYQEVAEVADRILADLPRHALALKLREEAARRIEQHKIERALAEWQIEELLELCAQRPEDGTAAYMTANGEVLLRLGELARAEKFSGWNLASGWWSVWRAACERLPPPPALLAEALRREQERRADEWYVVLHRLLDDPLGPEECDRVAASLNSELERLDLHVFRRGFLRKAQVGYAERLIKAQDWAGAEAKIKEFDEDDEEARRLRTRLDLRRAWETGISAVAEVLKDDWSRLVDYLGEEAYDNLLIAMREAWEGGHAETLGNLRMVISRVTTMREAPLALHSEFTQWEAWFKVEAEASGGELAGVKRLVTYLNETQRPPDPDLPRRLDKLVGLWRDQGRTEMLAWGYEAFRHHAPHSFTYHPAEDLRRQAEEEADRVERALVSNPNLDQPALDARRAEVRRCEADWQRLHDYLNELPEAPERPRLPESFGAARRRLETLYEVWTSLQRLQHADLRQPREREKLEACRRKLQGQLGDVAVQPRLLQQAARLDHLMRLPALEAQVMRAAEACGDQELWYEPGRFALVSKHLRQVEATFDKAHAKDGTLWGLISEEYGHRVSAAAGSFMPPPSPPDLRELARQFDELEAEERALISLLEELWSQRPVPSGPGRFDPEAHLNYLRRLPADAPRSRRALLNFRERFAKNDSMPMILVQSRRHLPEWICKYLDEGITFRSSES